MLNKGTYEKVHDDGVVKGQREFLLNLLVHRLGALPESVTRRVGGANTEELVRWGKRILNAPWLDDVFAAPQPPPCLEELLRPEIFKQGYEKGIQNKHEHVRAETARAALRNVGGVCDPASR